jgi:PIN domain nuclease of toxin-antitoxin system
MNTMRTAGILSIWRREYETITALPIEISYTLHVADLPRHHRDPFDRISISQSIMEDIPVMTVDKQFERYKANIILAG